jgi:AcrR family transcriptional regulator
MMQNADRVTVPVTLPSADEPLGSGTPASDVAARTAARTLAARTTSYTHEVRRLLDAALTVMGRCGTSSRPRVADIVAEAGLSNDAFYRHFPSKDALVAAMVEDGTERLASYVAHQMSKETTPAGQVCRWVEGVLSQAHGEVAAPTLALMWNGGSSTGAVAAGRHPAAARLATLLHGPFAELGSVDPPFDASLAAHAALGTLSDYLWNTAEPTAADIAKIIHFCLRAATPAAARGVRGEATCS